MSQNLVTNIWLWKEPDARWKKNILNHIQNAEPKDKDIVMLHSISLDGFEESIPISKYILDLCKSFEVFENKKIMFLSPKDLFLAIELCLGRQKKIMDDSEVEISDEDIIQCHKSYIQQFDEEGTSNKAAKQLHKFIHENNCVDLWLLRSKLSNLAERDSFAKHLSDFKILILGSFPDTILIDIIGLIACSKAVLNLTVEMDLDVSLRGNSPSSSPSHGVEVSSELLQTVDLVNTADEEQVPRSATEEYVEETVTAFLSLLVNSRSELALSKVMTSPVIDLSHEAFTKLKHLAEEKDMPMCQTAVSYVTRVRLGGKGYAPPPDCPMLPHLKGLELFVDTLNQMQTLIEEDLEPFSAIQRLINVLKKKLTKCGSDKLKPTAIETASENLKTIACIVVRSMKSKKTSAKTPLVCQENLDFLHSFLNYVSCSCSTFNPQRILLEKHAKRTPINLPPLLGYFRSPEDETSCEASVINEDSILSEKSIPDCQKPVSYFHHSDQSSSTVCVESQTPSSKVSFKDCLVEESLPKVKKGKKRAILGELSNPVFDVENKPEAKKTKKAPEKKREGPKLKDATNKSAVKKEASSKSKGNCKKFKLIEGQGRITTFFKSK